MPLEVNLIKIELSNLTQEVILVLAQAISALVQDL